MVGLVCEGEAKNPGPSSVPRSLLDDLERDLIVAPKRRARRVLESPQLSMHVGGSTFVDSDDDPLIAPSIPVTILVSGMLPTWVDERDSSDEVGHFRGGHREGFGEPPRRRLRLVLTQPTREDTLLGNRFAVLHEDEVEALVAQVSDETSESDTESVPDPEFESEEVRVEPEVRFQRENNFQAAFLSLYDINIKEMFETRAQGWFPSGHR